MEYTWSTATPMFLSIHRKLSVYFVEPEDWGGCVGVEREGVVSARVVRVSQTRQGWVKRHIRKR